MRERGGRHRVAPLAASAAALAATVLLLAATGAGAATITPVTTQDLDQGSIDDIGCTLRDAIRAANTNTAEDLGCEGDDAGADTILLEGGKTYKLELHGVDDTNVRGDLDITGPLTIRSSGPGLAKIDAVSNTLPVQPTGADRAIQVLPTAGAVTLEGVEITGGFRDVGSEVSGGGGVLNESELTVRDSEIDFNKTQGKAQVLGGGIYSRGALAKLIVLGSTITGNEVAELSADGKSRALGGGVAAAESAPSLVMTNSTVTANRAKGETVQIGTGGGIFAGDFSDNPRLPVATITNLTITKNEASFDAGGIQVPAGKISGTIIATNTVSSNGNPDCFGGATSGGGNILGNSGNLEFDCGFTAPTDLVGSKDHPINPNLGTLVPNGGLTRTQVPNPGSPAIDRGGPCSELDQRGYFRTAAPPCDSGAVEADATKTKPEEPPTEEPPGDKEPPSEEPPTKTPPSGGGTPPATPPPVPSIAPPALAPAQLVAAGKVKVAGGAKGRLTLVAGITASCPSAGATCSGSVTVKAAKGGATLGSTGLTLPAGSSAPVKLQLSGKSSDALRAAGAVKVKVIASLTAPGTAGASLTRAAKLKPPSS